MRLKPAPLDCFVLPSSNPPATITSITMRPHRPSWKTLVFSASTAIAQQITAFNRTSENDAFFNGTQLNLGVSVGERAMSLIARILPLTQAAGTQIPVCLG